MTVLRDGALILYGFVGDDYWDEGFTASEVLDALAEVGREADIDVHINSGGGYTNEGISIFNALSLHKGNVNVFIDAVAASSASIIAMAGDTITMQTGALMMIHDPSGGTWGTVDDHEKTKEMLDKLGDQMAGIYADQTGDDQASIRAEMKAELWMTGEEAVKLGFATESGTQKSEAFTAFDYRVYANAPKKLVAMAKKEKWTFEPKQETVAPAAKTNRPKKEPSKMTTKKKPASKEPVAKNTAAVDADGVEEPKARIKAIVKSEAAKGNEALAEHLAYDTEMTSEAAIAALEAAAPVADSDDDDTHTVENYQESRSKASYLAMPTGKQSKKKEQPTINATAIYASRRPQKGS